MLSFIVRRLLQTIPIVLAVALSDLRDVQCHPGHLSHPVWATTGAGCWTRRSTERMNKEFGLSDPVYVRFGEVRPAKLAQFDLGTSFRTRAAGRDRVGRPDVADVAVIVRRDAVFPSPSAFLSVLSRR